MSDILSRCPVCILTAAVLLTGADALLGAAITWGPASNITGDSDVLNTGSTVWAYSWSFFSTTVNGVSFATLTVTSNQNFSVSGNYSPPYLLYTEFTSGSGPFSLLSSNYMNLLTGALVLTRGNHHAGGAGEPVPRAQLCRTSVGE